jgi:hypothetical protein
MIDVKNELKLFIDSKKNINTRKTMKSFIRSLFILAFACTLGIAAQGEAKSKHKEHKEKHTQEKHERREQRHKEKAERKERRKHKDAPVVIILPAEKPVAIETPKVIIEQPVIELPVVDQAAPIGERK